MSHSNPESANAGPRVDRMRCYVYSAAALIAAIALGYYAYAVHAMKAAPEDDLKALRTFIASLPKAQTLREEYVDANGDLVADAPRDPAKFQNVEEIGFCLPSGDDLTRTEAEWSGFLSALANATGKMVTYRKEIVSAADQMAALREGKLHVTAFSTGMLAGAVNTAGFVPLAVAADSEGKYSYEMEILVPAASKFRSPADFKNAGRKVKIAFTTLSSNSGAKAPMVILKEKFGMLPGRDYVETTTGSHQCSIKELARGNHDAICVANDLLARALKTGDIKADQFRSIYKSESFPPLCLGIAHDLPADMAAKIKQVFQDYRFQGTTLEKRFVPQGKTRFALVDYKLDWAYVRQIDDSLTRLLDEK